MNNPVRIYVLHHPESALGQELADSIYHWFRMPSMEGIPVYIRSESAAGSYKPELPYSVKRQEHADVLEYIVPLVDATMVRDPVWHEYLDEISAQCEQAAKRRPKELMGCVMFPVALDSSAFSMSVLNQKNFIRHSSKADSAAIDETLKHLTEAMSRDLNVGLFPKYAGQKLKIFISYARADDITVPKALRDYIQSHTQCAAFFDENDIGFGEAFAQVLRGSVEKEARALIAVVGDNYASRPWCRWEVNQFLAPRKLQSRKPTGGLVHMYHSAIVIDTTAGPKMTRNIPELGHLPTLRWGKDRELLCLSMLMRETLFGARNVLAAREAFTQKPSPKLVVNRLPGPIGIQKLLNSVKTTPRERLSLSYPGNGLSLMELQLVKELFKGLQLTAFRDILNKLPGRMKKILKQGHKPLQHRVLAISYGTPPQLASLGYMPQHIEEAFVYLLRPLLRLGCDLLYAGAPLSRKDTVASDNHTGKSQKFTARLAKLLCDEDDTGNFAGAVEAARWKNTSRLFNPSTWPEHVNITADDEAAWINVSSLIRVPGNQILLPELSLPFPANQDDLARFLAARAYARTRMRKAIADEIRCPVPGNLSRIVRPDAFVFLGGKHEGYSGVMPGIFEEFIFAVKSGRPVYLLGGLGGATGLLKDALLRDAGKPVPDQLTFGYHAPQGSPSFGRMIQGYSELNLPREFHPRSLFDELERAVTHPSSAALSSILNNGLSHEENLLLLNETDTLAAMSMVLHGLARTILLQEPK